MAAGIPGGTGPERAGIDEAAGTVPNPRLGRERDAIRRQRGFTLLELLVVLALVGLVAAIAVPNLERLYGAITRTAERDYILDQFAGLGRRALHQRRNYVVFDAAGPRDPELAEPVGAGAGFPDPLRRGTGAAPKDTAAGAGSGRDFALLAHAGYEPYRIDVPEGWEIRLDPPLVIRANGVCLGAALTLSHRGEAEPSIALEPPWCRAEPGA